MHGHRCHQLLLLLLVAAVVVVVVLLLLLLLLCACVLHVQCRYLAVCRAFNGPGCCEQPVM
jgi:hypothetical protein